MSNLPTEKPAQIQNTWFEGRALFGGKMKSISSIILLTALLMACSPSSLARSETVSWARQVASIEKRLANEAKQAKPLIDRITSRRPTQQELNELVDYNNRITSLYDELVYIRVPAEARTVHDEYVENYAKVADSARYYVLAIKQNDLAYFDKSAIASQDANRIGAKAYSDFEMLLKRYSISCEEIDFCE